MNSPETTDSINNLENLAIAEGLRVINLFIAEKFYPEVKKYFNDVQLIGVTITTDGQVEALKRLLPILDSISEYLKPHVTVDGPASQANPTVKFAISVFNGIKAFKDRASALLNSYAVRINESQATQVLKATEYKKK